MSPNNKDKEYTELYSFFFVQFYSMRPVIKVTVEVVQDTLISA